MNHKDLSVNLYEKLQEAFLHSPQETEDVSLFNKLKKPLVLLLFFAGIGAFGTYNALSLLSQVATAKDNSSTVAIESSHLSGKPVSFIYVDISGSITRPNTYSLPPGTRLFELIEMAGGLNPEADRGFVSRNYNFSVILHDQQKIHIPSIFEVRDGIFTENKKIVHLSSQNFEDDTKVGATASELGKISINTAPASLLETLEGIGEVTANRIIANRPYASLEDLITKDVIKSSLFDKIESQLDL